MIISVTPKRLLKKPFFEKNGNLSSEKNNLASFSQSIDYHKPQVFWQKL